MIFTLRQRVYYEDTDFGGIVYHANFIKFIERARTEYVRTLGLDQNRLKDEDGIVFAVRKIEADYLAPAHFDDEIDIDIVSAETTAARLTMEQQVRRGDTVLFRAKVVVVALTLSGRPARLPAIIRRSTE